MLELPTNNITPLFFFMPTQFSQKLLDWYATDARELPWRGNPDPYAVWVSEIMLQQTRVETVIPYYKRWMMRFPSVFELSSASQQEVLSLWEGLGYYARARNLHQAASVIVAEYAGELPQEAQDLQTLPGIGRYTAAAIASIAFGKDEAALDGNIRRVLARVFDVTKPARSTQGERQLWQLSEENLPSGCAGEYNQAMMDLGATICTPSCPNCGDCPVQEVCQARKLGVQEDRPVKKARPAIPHYTVAAAVIRRNGQVFIAQRPDKGLLGGMWEFPGGKTEEDESLDVCLKREICEELGVDIEVGAPFGVYQHAFTHFRITLHAFECLLNDGTPIPHEHKDLRWVRPAELHKFPMGKIDRQIAKRLTA
ncbi:A/G-specific adenine glycosylase [Chloroflexota bacterium]